MIFTVERRFLKDSERLQARIAKGKLKRESRCAGLANRAAAAAHPQFGDHTAAVRGRASHRDPQAEPAGCRASASLRASWDRLEASLPGQEIRHEIKPKSNCTEYDFVVPFEPNPSNHKGSSLLMRNLG